DADVETDNVAFPEGTIVGDSVHDLFVHRDAGRGRIPVKSLERGPAAARHNQLFDPGVEIAPRASRLDEITRQLEALDHDGAVRLHGHDVLRRLQRDHWSTSSMNLVTSSTGSSPFTSCIATLPR